MGEMPVSLRLTEQTAEALKREAELQQVEPDDIAQRAIQSYLDFQQRDREIMRERIAEADKGIFISEEAMMRWMDQLEDDIDAPSPKPDVFIHRR